jgi:hypothetical protein
VVIETGFTESYHFGVARQVAQGGSEIGWCSAGFARMPADDRENIGKLLRELNRPLAAFKIGADADDFGDVRRTGSGDDFRQFVGEIRVIKMGVRVVECWH